MQLSNATPLSDVSFHQGWKTRKTLIKRVSGACEASWREFFMIYKGFVASIARGNGVAANDLDDVIQAIFLEIHRDFRRPNPPDFRERSFGAWLGQKVKWRVLEYHRHRHRREHPTDPADLDHSEADRPFEDVWAREWERKVLEVAMSKVAESPRNLLVFHALAVQNRPVEEVCRMFEISRSNADTIKKRVKDKLDPIVQEIEAGEV